MSNIQRHRIHTITPKGRKSVCSEEVLNQSKIETQQEKTLDPTPLGLGSVGLDDSTYPALLPATHFSFLDRFCSLPAAILGRHLLALASPTSRGCFLDASPARGVLP